MGKKESRRDARLKRKIAKLANIKEKNVRLSNYVKIESKFIRSSSKPDLSKAPRFKSPENYKTYYFSWDDSHSDIDGHWSWQEPRQWNDDEYSKIIKPHLDSHNNNSWGEIEVLTYSGKNKFRKLYNKYQNLESICPEAQERWLGLDLLSEFEELFRMRLGEDRRIWGIRVQHFFFLVWYDRYHSICPIEDD